jgi:hypothetical protein
MSTYIQIMYIYILYTQRHVIYNENQVHHMYTLVPPKTLMENHARN